MNTIRIGTTIPATVVMQAEIERINASFKLRPVSKPISTLAIKPRRKGWR